MSSYNYTILDITNLSDKITTLIDRINLDPEINPAIIPVVSVNYVDPDIVITFVAPMTDRDNYIVGTMVNTIFFNYTPGYTFDYQNRFGVVREIYQTATNPTVQWDINSGYGVGSKVYNLTEQTMWVCIDATAGAAVWIELCSCKDTSGGNSIIPFANGTTPSILTTVLSGLDLVSTGSIVGFGNCFNNVNILNVISLITPLISLSNMAFTMPRTGTITSIYSYFSLTIGVTLGLVGTATIRAQIYRNGVRSDPNEFTPIAGTLHNLTPNLIGILNIGDAFGGSVTGLNIVIPAGTRLMMVVWVETTLSLVTTITGHYSGGMNIV